jgi:hopanoid biosynthesis associated protein HpnK
MAREVNEAIELAHAGGILTAASLMVNGRAAADAIARARRLPTLRVGLHLALVDAAPSLPCDELPDLLKRDGCLRTDLAKLGFDLFLRSGPRRQMAAEIEAQFNAYRLSGLSLDHVNAHHHFHLHPTIAALIVDIGKRYGLRAVRVPAEPGRVLDRIEPSGKPHRDPFIAPWTALLRKRVRARRLATTDHVFGRAWSGAMSEARVAGILEHLPDGISEMYLHPATVDRFEGAAPGYRYTDELAALVSPRVKALAAKCGARRGGFADVLPA